MPTTQRDAFYGGYCSALSAALYGDDGTSTAYLEAVRAVDRSELLNFARRNKDMELPNIRRAIRLLNERDRQRADAARATSDKQGKGK